MPTGSASAGRNHRRLHELRRADRRRSGGGTYRDDLDDGGASDHSLANHPGENPVAYDACSAGLAYDSVSAELGFSTFYTNNGRDDEAGLTSGDVVGVVQELAGALATSLSITAPDGSQYFTLEDTGGFVFVEMDPVAVADYTDVRLLGWIRIEGENWEANDLVRVWGTYDGENCGRGEADGERWDAITCSPSAHEVNVLGPCAESPCQNGARCENVGLPTTRVTNARA